MRIKEEWLEWLREEAERNGYIRKPLIGNITDKCKLLATPANSAHRELEFLQKVVDDLGCRVCIFMIRDGAHWHTLSNVVKRDQHKYDLIILHMAMEPLPFRDDWKENHAPFPTASFNATKHFVLNLYNELSTPTVILTNDDYYKDYVDPTYNILFYETFYFDVIYNMPKVDVSDKKQFKLSCLNKQARFGRCHMFTELVQKDYFSDIYYSFLAQGLYRSTEDYTEILHGATAGNPARPRYAYLLPMLRLYPEKTKEIDDVMQQYINTFPIEVEPELQWDDYLNIGCLNNNNINIDVGRAYTDSLCHLVTETFPLWYSFLTEKTFKPVSCGMPFFLHAGPYSIKRLRDDGFDVYDDVINHSYDEELDYLKRTDMLLESVADYMKNGYERDPAREKRNIEHFYSQETFNKFYQPFISRLQTILM